MSESGKAILAGDVEFDSVKEKAAAEVIQSIPQEKQEETKKIDNLSEDGYDTPWERQNG